MRRDMGFRRPLHVIAGEFAALAGEYRLVSARVKGVERKCVELEVPHDQVLEIAFKQAVPYVDKASTCLDQVAARLMDRSEAGDSGMLDPAAEADASDSLNPASEKGAADVYAVPLEHVSAELRDTAYALLGAMNRALDLVDEVGDAELVGDSHPFGHIVQGICIPYILLAAEVLEAEEA